MILADSNVLILAAQGAHPELARFLVEREPAFSAISYVEALGYHKITQAEQTYLERFFAGATISPVADAVIHQAVRLRQKRRMSLGDALIAGTALVRGWKLATRNAHDFRGISGLEIVDPLLAN